MADKIDKSLKERIDRGRQRLLDTASLRNECFEFWRGNQYVYRTNERYLVSQSTTTNPDGSGKPKHRYRQVRNVIVDVVAQEVSAATQRVPAYDVVPATVDDEDISAARLAGKVLAYGYDQWRMRPALEDVVTHAVVGDEGFAWPYWDSNIGPFFKEGGKTIGQGDVRIGVFGANEVYWEPGVDFMDSRWLCVEQACTEEEVKARPGYNGAKLEPNASSVSDTRFSDANNPQEAKLVLVTDYLERPSKQYPQGRWITLHKDVRIQEDREYPCKDFDGNVMDEPVLHRLSYFSDPDSDRDMGLVRHLLDPQRTVNDCTNKQLIWKDMALNPQVIIRNGILRQRLTDEPGAVFHLRGNDEPIWRPVPPIPGELQQIKDEARADIANIAAQNDIPSQVESGKAIQALIERDQSRRANFLANLAEFYSRLGRHCLYLVQRHYTEERLLKIRGEGHDVEIIRDFLGSQLRGQADARVYPGSIEPMTKQGIEAKILAFADRGWVGPEMAMRAIQAGSAETLLRDVEKDYARARMVLQKIQDGPEYLFNSPQRLAFEGEIDPVVQTDPMTGEPLFETDEFGVVQVDPMTGEPIPKMGPPIDPETGQPQTTVPAWMPRPFDNVRVHKSVFENYMKGSDYDQLDEDMKRAINLYYSALLEIEAKAAAKAEQEQMMLAEQLGSANATRPPTAGQPSMPSLDNQPSPGPTPQKEL